MKFNKLMAFAAAATLLAACNGGGGGTDPVDPSVLVTKSGLISANETWSADSIYILEGRVVVDAGVTLTRPSRM